MHVKWPDIVSLLNKDKYCFALADYPLLTLYDDNLFLRNDYDVLTTSQRRYIIRFFSNLGFKQKTGRSLINQDCRIEFLKPQYLAQSAFKPELLRFADNHYYCITPTLFAECIFHTVNTQNESTQMEKLALLMEKAPFNMTLLKDINRTTSIRTLTKQYCDSINAHQKKLIENKFKFRRGLS